jgi:hypothetical protein
MSDTRGEGRIRDGFSLTLTNCNLHKHDFIMERYVY